MAEDKQTKKADLNNRPTKTLTTPNGHEVVVYEYITGGEMRQFQAQFLKGMNVNDLGTSGDETTALRSLDATQLLKAQELLVDLLVVSVDGNEEATVMDLLPADTEYVIAELDKLAQPSAGKKK